MAHCNSEQPPERPANPARGIRWRPPVLILLGAAALILLLRFVLANDTGSKFLATISTVGLTGVLLLGWLVFFAGQSKRLRWLVIGVVLVVMLGLAVSFEIQGWTGDLKPIIGYRWSSRHENDLADQLRSQARGSAQTGIDLTTTTPDDFPQFLGPNRNGTLGGARLARDWSTTPPRLVWRQSIGQGCSSFAVVGSHAVNMQQLGAEELVVCYQLDTGKAVWTHSDEAAFHSNLGGNGPRATPAIAGGRVFTVGGTGLMNCLDGATGKPLWSHDLNEENNAATPQWGKSCSPLVIDDPAAGQLVVVSAGGPQDRSLVAYRADDGRLVWHAGTDGPSYASPVLATLAGRRQILMVNAASVTSHEPARGEILWDYEWLGSEFKVPQPVPLAPDRVLLSAGYGIGCVMLKVEEGPGSSLVVSELWKNRQLKPKFTNLVVRNGYVYGIDDGKALVCLELATGSVRWRSRGYDHGQVLLVNDLLLIAAESGELVLVEAAPEAHRELARFQALSQKTWNNPVLSGGFLLLRNDAEAVCLELPLEEPSAGAAP